MSKKSLLLSSLLVAFSSVSFAENLSVACQNKILNMALENMKQTIAKATDLGDLQKALSENK